MTPGVRTDQGRAGKPDPRRSGRCAGCAQPAPGPIWQRAGADSCLRMPGEEEKRAFLEAREELASALRRDSGQAFTQEQLWPLLGTSLPPEARYLQLDAARLVRCNAHGEVRPAPAREEDRGPEFVSGLTALCSLTAPSPETTSTPSPRP